jgi:hypothetical protein
MSPQERYAETAALVAYMEDDRARLAELLDDMLPAELLELARTLDGLREAALETRFRLLRERSETPEERCGKPETHPPHRYRRVGPDRVGRLTSCPGDPS